MMTADPQNREGPLQGAQGYGNAGPSDGRVGPQGLLGHGLEELLVLCRRATDSFPKVTLSEAEYGPVAAISLGRCLCMFLHSSAVCYWLPNSQKQSHYNP